MRFSGLTPIAAATIMVLAGCSGGAGTPSADPDGMVTFACSIAEQNGPWQDQDLVPDGPGYPLPSAIGGLLGVMGAATMEGYEEFADPGKKIYSGVVTGKTDRANEAREEILAACDEGGISTTATTGLKERVAFACSLAGEVHGQEEPVEEWAVLGTDDGFLLGAAGAAGTLLGGTQVAQSAEFQDLHEAGINLIDGISRFDYEGIAQSLAAITDHCP